MTTTRLTILFCLLFSFLFVVFLLNLSFGAVAIPLGELPDILTHDSKKSWQIIFWDFRLPKALTAVIVGMGLGVSGLQMQTLFRNALAGPFVLGINSGASLGVAFLLLFVSQFAPHWLSTNSLYTPWLTSIAATLGAAIVLLIILLASFRVGSNTGLLIIGLMFGSIASAIVSMLQYFSAAEQVKSYLIWTFGSLSQVTWQKLPLLIVLNLLALAFVWAMHKALDALLLGERYAQSMGVHIKRARIGIILSTSIMAGSITAFCGPIGFIGLAVPHLGKLLIPTAKHRVLIPVVALSGAILLLLCESISQLPLNGQVLPINAVTAMFGAPLVIWVILKKRSL